MASGAIRLLAYKLDRQKAEIAITSSEALNTIPNFLVLGLLFFIRITPLQFFLVLKTN